MVLVLLAVGAVLTVVGLGGVAFGIPNNEFGTGNTAIAAGVTAMTGGLVLIGLSYVLRELIAIRTALAAGAPAGAVAGAPLGRAERPEPPARGRPAGLSPAPGMSPSAEAGLGAPLFPEPEPPSAAIAAERLR
ncbi:hypothetical protein ABTU92_23580, partial [Rhodoplanes sp. SY1]